MNGFSCATNRSLSIRKLATNILRRTLNDLDRLAAMDPSDEMDGPMATGITEDAWDPKTLIGMIPDLKLRKARSFSSWNPRGGAMDPEYGKSTRIVKNTGATRRAVSGGHLENRTAISSPAPSKPENEEGFTTPASTAVRFETLRSTLNNMHDSNFNSFNDGGDKDSPTMMSKEAAPELLNNLLVQSSSHCSVSDANRMECDLNTTIGNFTTLDYLANGISRSASESDMSRYTSSMLEEPSDVVMTDSAEERIAYNSPTGYPSPPNSEDGDDDADGDRLQAGLDSEPFRQYLNTEIPRLPSPPLSDTDVIRTIPKPEFPICVSDDGPSPFSLEAQKRIMRWRSIFSFEDWHMPVWLVEPKIEHIWEIVQPYLKHLGCESDDFLIEYLTQGTWHKVYTVTTSSRKTKELVQYIFRIALPVDPYYKTECEVATTELVRYSTRIPVPIIYAYDSSTKNKLGLEWMLMERVAGEKLKNVWPDMSDDLTTTITKHVADWSKQLSRIVSDKIGGIYMRHTGSQVQFYVGRSVHQCFHRDGRLSYNVHRGPFESLHDFYDAMLAVIGYENDAIMDRLVSMEAKGSKEPLNLVTHTTQDDMGNDGSDDGTADERIYVQADKDDDEDFQNWLQVDPDYSLPILRDGIAKIRSNLRTLCDRSGNTSEKLETLLAHPDISEENIFVDETGVLVALLDWENVELEPPICLAEVPKFLDSDYASHVPNGPHEVDRSLYDTIKEAEDCEDLNQKRYLEKLDNFIKTCLSEVYQKELEQSEPHLSRVVQQDFPESEIDLNYRIMNAQTWNCFRGNIQWVDDQLNPKEDSMKELSVAMMDLDRDKDKSEENDTEGVDLSIRMAQEDIKAKHDGGEPGICIDGGTQYQDTEKDDIILESEQNDELIKEDTEDSSDTTLVEEEHASGTEDEISDDTMIGRGSTKGKHKVRVRRYTEIADESGSMAKKKFGGRTRLWVYR